MSCLIPEWLINGFSYLSQFLWLINGTRIVWIFIRYLLKKYQTHPNPKHNTWDVEMWNEKFRNSDGKSILDAVKIIGKILQIIEKTLEIVSGEWKWKFWPNHEQCPLYFVLYFFFDKTIIFCIRRYCCYYCCRCLEFSNVEVIFHHRLIWKITCRRYFVCVWRAPLNRWIELIFVR